MTDNSLLHNIISRASLFVMHRHQIEDTVFQHSNAWQFESNFQSEFFFCIVVQLWRFSHFRDFMPSLVFSFARACIEIVSNIFLLLTISVRIYLAVIPNRYQCCRCRQVFLYYVCTKYVIIRWLEECFDLLRDDISKITAVWRDLFCLLFFTFQF